MSVLLIREVYVETVSKISFSFLIIPVPVLAILPVV